MEFKLDDLDKPIDVKDINTRVAVVISEKPIAGLGICLEIEVNGNVVFCMHKIADLELICPKKDCFTRTENFQEKKPLDKEKEP